MNEPDDSTIHFRRILFPHRSAGGIVLFRVLLLLAFTLTALSMTFIALGAWPVSGFLGLELVLLAGAFWLNERRGRMYEIIALTERELVVERVDSGGRRQRWAFQPHWLRLRTHVQNGRNVGLELRSHGRSLVVGTFLAPEEIAELGVMLEDAIRRLSGPQASAPD